jgi:predicted nucleic-acid-binding Zn-ribbon protein
MSEVRKCSKCGGQMEIGYLPGAFSWSAGKNLWRIKDSKRIFGYACRKCGHVEFYLEKEKKE